MQSIFNQKLLAFARDLQNLNASLTNPIHQIGLLENGIQLTAALDSSAPVRLFREHVSVPYGAHILNKDEKFFLEETSDLSAHHQSSMNLIDMLRSVWKTLSKEDREAIFEHMILLIKIEKKI